MELNEVAMSRRSVRNYKPDMPIGKEVIEELVRFAQEAPSWKNTQTGRYYVLQEPSVIKEFMLVTLPEFNQKSSENASALIITTFETKISGFNREQVPDNELGDMWGAYDLGLQNAYLILKARELGLDTLIMGIRDADKIREKLQIPESQQIVAVIALGYNAGESLERPRRRDLEKVLKIYDK